MYTITYANRINPIRRLQLLKIIIIIKGNLIQKKKRQMNKFARKDLTIESIKKGESWI